MADVRSLQPDLRRAASMYFRCYCLDSLCGGEVNAVEGIPHYEDARHVAENHAVEAEGDYHW